jgi:hypothetical protein
MSFLVHMVVAHACDQSMHVDHSRLQHAQLLQDECRPGFTLTGGAGARTCTQHGEHMHFNGLSYRGGRCPGKPATRKQHVTCVCLAPAGGGRSAHTWQGCVPLLLPLTHCEPATENQGADPARERGAPPPHGSVCGCVCTAVCSARDMCGETKPRNRPAYDTIECAEPPRGWLALGPGGDGPRRHFANLLLLLLLAAAAAADTDDTRQPSASLSVSLCVWVRVSAVPASARYARAGSAASARQPTLSR